MKNNSIVRVYIYLMLWAGVVGVCRPTAAQSAQSELPKLMFLVPTDAPDTYLEQIEATRSHLSDVEMQLEETPISSPPGGSDADMVTLRSIAQMNQSALIVWFDTHLPNRVFFFLPDDEGGQLIFRSIDTELHTDRDGLVESKAMVVRSTAVTALAIQAQQGPPPSSETTPITAKSKFNDALTAPTPEAKPTPEAARFGIALSAVLDVPIENQAAWGACGFSAYVFLSRHMTVGIGYALGKKLSFESNDIRINLRRHPIHAELMIPFKNNRFTLAPTLGAQMEIQSPQIQTSRDDIESINQQSRFRLGVIAGIQGTVPLSQRVAIFLTPKVLVQLRNTDYAVDVNDSNVILFRQKRLSFWGELGIQTRF